MKIAVVFGTRPEAIKMAPLVRMLKNDDQLKCRVAVTAQHREMLDQVLQLFDIVPDHDLNIMQAGQTLFDITGRALAGLQRVLEAERPDLVLVHGDTTTTFVAALASYYMQVPVGHVEAGLRTGNKYSPYPEEMNRRLTGALCDVHFAPTAGARDNLLREGVDPERVYVTGNTVIDALLATVRDEYRFGDSLLDGMDFSRHRLILMTTHRRENLGDPMRDIYLALRDVLREHPDVRVIFPVHKNPAVRRVVQQVLGDSKQVDLIEPMDYEPWINLVARCHLVLTDSGGIQEEAPSLGKPVLVLRNTTERPEAVEAGTVRLVGTDRTAVRTETERLLNDQAYYRAMAEAVNPYGDGMACGRIVQAVKHAFKLSGHRPREFGL
ncbi:UDP-N-acetylglucosamine 2-epimerase (non-hydrolyzing) [Desulfoscipio sp. XC116]|uniref:non-hydrolyzing UDP-N-acetylglucosamine 2-epimerase n=1 Tax=Desulfoscipio sp. XC116 TaxID=3144975 RepID=UPI00325AD2F8